MKHAPILTFMLLLAGCATATGPTYDPAIMANKRDHILIYRPHESVPSPNTARIKLDGRVVCSLPENSFTLVEAKPGQHELAMGQYGVDVQNQVITTNGGKSFLRVAYIQGPNLGMAFGAIGGAIGGATAGDPYSALLVTESQAGRELNSAKRADCK